MERENTGGNSTRNKGARVSGGIGEIFARRNAEKI